MAQAAQRRIGGSSLGMKQRLGLAAALLGRPRNIVLDEPMNGLDPHGMEWMRAFLRDAAASGHADLDRKSTRLNSSHVAISYAVFCLKKKNITHTWDAMVSSTDKRSI